MTDSVVIFQSTLPVRGATTFRKGLFHHTGISIHAPRAGSDLPRNSTPQKGAISIHAPRAGSDPVVMRVIFLSGISIHAPRAGSDDGGGRTKWQVRNFNPRSPCGERLTDIVIEEATEIFQSTLPVRGATCRGIRPRKRELISIHAPRAGSDKLTTA